MKYKNKLFAAFVLAAFSASASATVVTFDDTINTNASGFDTQGYDFEIPTNHYHLESTFTRYGTNSATTSLIIDDFGGDNSLTVTSMGGTAFDFSSFDIIAQGWGSTTVSIEGALSGGGSVNYVYNDSDDNTFETVVLGWTNLLSVTFNGTGNSGSGENFYRVDNLDLVSSVPAPASILLLGLGLLGLGFGRKRQ